MIHVHLYSYPTALVQPNLQPVFLKSTEIQGYPEAESRPSQCSSLLITFGCNTTLGYSMTVVLPSDPSLSTGYNGDYATLWTEETYSSLFILIHPTLGQSVP